MNIIDELFISKPSSPFYSYEKLTQPVYAPLYLIGGHVYCHDCGKNHLTPTSRFLVYCSTVNFSSRYIIFYITMFYGLDSFGHMLSESFGINFYDY